MSSAFTRKARSIRRISACRRSSRRRSSSSSTPTYTNRGNNPMALKLYYHPLSSFCWKALIALYENDTPFDPVLVNLQDPGDRDKFLKMWGLGKFPVIVDGTRNDWLGPESSIIIEYLAKYYPGKSKLVPDDADMARRVRMADRFFDFNVHIHMQKIVGDRMRPEGGHDPIGVEYAR